MLGSQTLDRTYRPAVSNRLLASLPPDALAELLPHLQRVSLGPGAMLHEENGRVDHVYFLEEGIVSIRIVTSDGVVVPITTVGREGVLGLQLFLGSDRIFAKEVVELAVTAWRMSAVDFRRVAQEDWLKSRLQRSALALFMRVAHESACNRVHHTLERCARLLLSTYDQAGGARLALTQGLAAQMLGVRRVSVGVAAQQLRDMGCIEYVRGRVTIRDRARLENVACQCYPTLRRNLESLLGQCE